MAEDQRVVFEAMLQSIGLDAQDVKDVLNTAVTETQSAESFLENIYKTGTFKAEYPEYHARIQAKKTTWDPATIKKYREEAKRLMFDYGLPPNLFDTNADLSNLIIQDVSIDELNARITEGYNRVKTAPVEIRAAFDNFFGAQGDAALASFFLDPTKADAFLQRSVQQAEFSGQGKRFGFDIDLSEAERLRQLGLDSQQAAQGFRQASELRPLEEETISEGVDITEQEIIEGAFGVGETKKLQQRARERSAAFQGGGGAAQTQGGFGIGEAR